MGRPLHGLEGVRYQVCRFHWREVESEVPEGLGPHREQRFVGILKTTEANPLGSHEETEAERGHMIYLRQCLRI